MEKIEFDIEIGEEEYLAKVDYTVILHPKERCELGYTITEKYTEIDYLDVEIYDYNGKHYPELKDKGQEIIEKKQEELELASIEDCV